MNRLWLLLLVSGCAFSAPLQSQQDNRFSLFGGFKADNQAQVSIGDTVSLPLNAGLQAFEVVGVYPDYGNPKERRSP